MSEKTHRFLHRLAGRRLTADTELEAALKEAKERPLITFGADKVFTTKSDKVAELLKKHKGYEKDFFYVKSAEELKAQQEAETALSFIKTLKSMPGINLKMVIDGCNDIQTRVWARSCGIETAKDGKKLPTDVLKKALIDQLITNDPGPKEKTQPQDNPPQAELLKKESAKNA